MKASPGSNRARTRRSRASTPRGRDLVVHQFERRGRARSRRFAGRGARRTLSYAARGCGRQDLCRHGRYQLRGRRGADARGTAGERSGARRHTDSDRNRQRTGTRRNPRAAFPGSAAGHGCPSWRLFEPRRRGRGLAHSDSADRRAVGCRLSHRRGARGYRDGVPVAGRRRRQCRGTAPVQRASERWATLPDQIGLDLVGRALSTRLAPQGACDRRPMLRFLAP